MFIWRVCAKALPTREALAVRIKGLDMQCPTCGFYLESDCHALLECKVARLIWEASGVDCVWCEKEIQMHFRRYI